jgi:hypothetical protein
MMEGTTGDRGHAALRKALSIGLKEPYDLGVYATAAEKLHDEMAKWRDVATEQLERIVRAELAAGRAILASGLDAEQAQIFKKGVCDTLLHSVMARAETKSSG